MRVGCTIDYFKGANLVDSFRQLKEMGMNSCQLVCWDRSVLDAEHAAEVKKICEDEGVEISAVWCGWEGRVSGTSMKDRILWDLYRKHTASSASRCWHRALILQRSLG